MNTHILVSINILLSQGSNVKLIVKNSFADAVDIDFSSLSIDNLEINDSGNDCIDVSGGNYEVVNANLSGCEDKALSIGEMSKWSLRRAGPITYLAPKLSTTKDWCQPLSNCKTKMDSVANPT